MVVVFKRKTGEECGMPILIFLGGGSFSIASSLLLLVLLSSGLQRSGQKLEKLFVLQFLVALDKSGVIRRGGDLNVTILGQQQGSQELDNNTITFVQDIVRQDSLVLGALNDTHTALTLIFEITEGEGEVAELGVDFRQNLTRSCHLQLVTSTSLLVDSSTGLHLSGLSFTSGNENIDSIDFIFSKADTFKITQVTLARVDNNLFRVTWSVSRHCVAFPT